MNLEQMQIELSLIVKDASLQPLLVGWINAAILDVATDYDLPPLALAEPYSLGVDTSKWLWPLPEIFHKNLFMVKRVNADGTQTRLHHIHKDPAHTKGKDHTLTGDHVTELAVIPQGKGFYLGIYPLAEDNLNLWFYRRPAVLVLPADECSGLKRYRKQESVFLTMSRASISIHNLDQVLQR